MARSDERFVTLRSSGRHFAHKRASSGRVRSLRACQALSRCARRSTGCRVAPKWSFRRAWKIFRFYNCCIASFGITESENVYGSRALSCVGVLVPVATPAAGGQQLRIWQDGSSPHRTAQPSSSSPISAAADALMCDSASAIPVSDSTISGWIVLHKRIQFPR